jgi:hypothetical protein
MQNSGLHRAFLSEFLPGICPLDYSMVTFHKRQEQREVKSSKAAIHPKPH